MVILVISVIRCLKIVILANNYLWRNNLWLSWSAIWGTKRKLSFSDIFLPFWEAVGWAYWGIFSEHLFLRTTLGDSFWIYLRIYILRALFLTQQLRRYSLSSFPKIKNIATLVQKMCNKKWGLIRGGVIRKCVQLEKIHKDLTLRSDLLDDVNFNLDGCGPVGMGLRKFNHLLRTSIID